MNGTASKQFSSEIITINMDNFEAEVLQAKHPMLIDFWAPWCGPCRVLAPIIDQLAQDFAGRIRFGKVNIDENDELARELGIQAVPTVLLFNGDSVDMVSVGVKQRQEMRAIIENLITPKN